MDIAAFLKTFPLLQWPIYLGNKVLLIGLYLHRESLLSIFELLNLQPHLTMVCVPLISSGNCHYHPLVGQGQYVFNLQFNSHTPVIDSVSVIYHWVTPVFHVPVKVDPGSQKPEFFSFISDGKTLIFQ